MAEVYEWVRNIVIYLILNTIVMNLLGNKSYKKYAGIVSGMILMLIVVTPFLKLLKMDEILDYYLNSNIFRTDMTDYKKELKLMEEKQKEAVFGDIKEKVKETISELLSEEGLYLYDVDVVINQDVSSDAFGEIESINVTAGYEENEGMPVSKINIEKITIPKINEDNKNRDEGVNIPSPEEIHIKNKLSDFYNMEQDNINISIQGG